MRGLFFWRLVGRVIFTKPRAVREAMYAYCVNVYRAQVLRN
jgi:hypothetical protein